MYCWRSVVSPLSVFFAHSFRFIPQTHVCSVLAQIHTASNQFRLQAASVRWCKCMCTQWLDGAHFSHWARDMFLRKYYWMWSHISMYIMWRAHIHIKAEKIWWNMVMLFSWQYEPSPVSAMDVGKNKNMDRMSIAWERTHERKKVRLKIQIQRCIKYTIFAILRHSNQRYNDEMGFY